MLASKKSFAIFRSSVYVLQFYDRDMDEFYAGLQLTTSLPKSDMVLIVEDWNARVSHDAATINSVIWHQDPVRQWRAPSSFC